MRYLTGLLGAALLATTIAAAETKFVLNGQNTSIEFVGTKPGGKHEGGFKTVTGTALVGDAGAATLKISVEIETASLYSDNAKLTNHLKSPDFFGVKSNPRATFVTTKVERAGAGYTIAGDLTLLGKTKAVSFPAQIDAGAKGLNLKSTFKINRQDFGMTYGTGKIDNDVTIKVSVSAKN